jgi:hypothetical protein
LKEIFLMEESQSEEKISRVTFWAIFCGAILIGAVISIAALSTEAEAARNAYRYPPYAIGKSIPNQTCEQGTYYKRCAVRSDNTGQARIYSNSANNNWIGASAEHNILVSNPSITVTTPNFVVVKYTNSAHGKFYLASFGGAQAVLKVGLWTTVLRQADQVWIKDTFYAKEYSATSLANGEYIIPYTNFVKTLNKNNNPGTYGIQTYFEVRTYGASIPVAAIGTLDAYTSSKSYTLYSDRLAVECSACP